MAGLHTPSIHTVTSKVHLSQSSVLGNTFLEDTPVTPGAVVCEIFFKFNCNLSYRLRIIRLTPMHGSRMFSRKS